MSLFNELKRRNVFKVGIAYIIAAWLTMQFADVILNNIDAPGWVFQAIMLLLGIGLLFAIFFAWVFELTPEGLKKEKDVDRSQSITPQTGRKLDFVIIGVLVVALGYFVVDKFSMQPAAQTGTGTTAGAEQSPGQAVIRSIAVLPFVNMSEDASNEYFSVGIAEEILNVLANIRELKVVGRTSSFAFKGKNEDLRTIGEKLNVNTLLEGSVRKDDKRQKVRVTVQLINVDDGYHIWSESYDRSLEDIFAIQEEIALEVAAALKIELLGEEQEEITSLAHSNMNAYDLYLKARSAQEENSFTSLERAVEGFSNAIALDPHYVPAQVGLAKAYLKQGQIGSVGMKESLDLSELLLVKILEKDPQNGDALALMAEVLLGMDNADLERAEEFLRQAMTQNPRNVEAMKQMTFLLDMTNRGSESLQYAREAAVLEPYSTEVQWILSYLHRHRLDLESSLEASRKIREIEPASPVGFHSAGRAYHAAGRIDQMIYWMTQAFIYDPADNEMAAVLSRAWLDLDDLQQAEQWLAKAVAIDPEHPATIGARIAMLNAKEMTSEALQLARQAHAKRLQPRWYFKETISRVLVGDAVKKGHVDKALQLLEEIWPEDFASIERSEKYYDIGGRLQIIQILLMQDPASAEAGEYVSGVQRYFADADKAIDPNYWREATAFLAVIQDDREKAVTSLQEAFENDGLRIDWRERYIDNYIWASLESHPGFRQIITMLEAEAVTQRENAYRLLASLD